MANLIEWIKNHPDINIEINTGRDAITDEIVVCSRMYRESFSYADGIVSIVKTKTIFTDITSVSSEEELVTRYDGIFNRYLA